MSKKIIHWPTEQDKYEAIGFLARPGVVQNIEANVPTKFIEKFKDEYKGKYIGKPYDVGSKKGGSQFIIRLNHVEGCPDFLKGVIDGKMKLRINATDFVRDLVNNYGFVFTCLPQNSELIRSIVESIGVQEYEWFKKTYYPNETLINEIGSVLESKYLDVEISDEDSEEIRSLKTTKKKSKSPKAKKSQKLHTKFTDQQLQNVGWNGEKYLYDLIEVRNNELLCKFYSGEIEDVVVEWFNKGFEKKDNWTDKSIGKGCDMYLWINGKKLLIEVKTSIKKTGLFSMSSKEMQTMKKYDDSYFLVKINYLERILSKKKPEVIVYKSPYRKFLIRDI